MTGFDRARAWEILRQNKFNLSDTEALDALEQCVQTQLSPRETGWLVDVAEEGIAHLLDVVQEIEADPVPTEDELELAVQFGVRADCGRRAIDKLGASYEPRVS